MSVHWPDYLVLCFAITIYILTLDHSYFLVKSCCILKYFKTVWSTLLEHCSSTMPDTLCIFLMSPLSILLLIIVPGGSVAIVLWPLQSPVASEIFRAQNYGASFSPEVLGIKPSTVVCLRTEQKRLQFASAPLFQKRSEFHKPGNSRGNATWRFQKLSGKKKKWPVTWKKMWTSKWNQSRTWREKAIATWSQRSTERLKKSAPRGKPAERKIWFWHKNSDISEIEKASEINWKDIMNRLNQAEEGASGMEGEVDEILH